MRRRIYLPLAITSLLAISSAGAYAQGLAPSALNLASAEQETKKDIVQVITKERVPSRSRKRIVPRAGHDKKNHHSDQEKTGANDCARAWRERLTTEPVRPIAKPYTSETTRPVARYSFKTPQGKKESVPVITQYYPKQIVYPLAKIDRHIDRKLMQAATIAQERAHAHSRSRCWHYVKDALLASGVIDSRPKTA